VALGDIQSPKHNSFLLKASKSARLYLSSQISLLLIRGRQTEREALIPRSTTRSGYQQSHLLNFCYMLGSVPGTGEPWGRSVLWVLTGQWNNGSTGS
jgi:hypothetical protein